MDVDSRGATLNIFGVSSLQWSHVLMDVDRVALAVRPAAPVHASMEPRPDGRG